MGELQTAPQVAAEVVNAPDLNQDRYDALIELAGRIENVVAAQTKIRTALLKLAMPGDFVRFGDKVELNGPGAERIATSIGMNVTNVHDEKLSWEDKIGHAYTWRYIGDVSLGKRTIEKVEGRAGSRDKFFGYEKGAWKELSDVKEADIRTSARRSLYKEGVKLLLGLRGLPYDEAFLNSIGLDPKKVRTVEFGQKGEQKVDAAPAGTPVIVAEVKAFKGTNKTTGKDFVRYDVIDDKGAKYSTFDEKVAEYARKVKESKKPVCITYTVGKFGNDIKEVVEAPAAPEGAEAAS